MSWYVLTQSPIETIVGLEVADALTGQTIHCAVARITQTLSLSGQCVQNTVRKLITIHVLAWITMISWTGPRRWIIAFVLMLLAMEDFLVMQRSTNFLPEWVSISLSILFEAALLKSSRMQGTALVIFILFFTTTLPFLKLRMCSSLNLVRLDCRNWSNWRNEHSKISQWHHGSTVYTFKYITIYHFPKNGNK